MLDVPFRSARQLAVDIKKKKIGCLELLDLYLARVEKYDGALNAVVVRDFERARTRARAADRALAKRDVWGPLHGRSEEHTSELQSLAYLVCRLLLEKKKKTRT